MSKLTVEDCKKWAEMSDKAGKANKPKRRIRSNVITKKGKTLGIIRWYN